MKRKSKKNKKNQSVDPGLGFSPYQRDKGMAYTKSVKDHTRDDRRQTKRNLKRGDYDG